ncbi:diaminopimelate decarboxylase [Micromonospora pallida]|uniref:Diaminopimelate decarboxylase n=1 Tax=Micromonospora pallida TaxID=145854 RepID=A0A1C6S9R4_9ACTN|nr:hypothetical protein [Micromonospora pallida]SCL26146.1 diaminopimelate decarboxylase [Micromonospora pallida]
MTTVWDELAGPLRSLEEEANGWLVAAPRDVVFVPPDGSLSPAFVAAARAVPDVSFVLWDAANVRRHVGLIQRVLAENGIGLAVGLKACANRTVLSILAGMGLLADAQSPGEVDLARSVGFGTVTATGPSFRPPDLDRLLRDGVLLDVQSPLQFAQLEERGTTEPVGFRARVRLPERLRHPSTYDVVSRFGIELNQTGLERVARSPLTVERIRVHTGEALSADVTRSLEYRARLGVLLAAAFPEVREINLGGGFLALSRNPSALPETFKRVGEVFDEAADTLGRRLRCWLEPGSALLIDSAYLVTEVLDVDPSRHAVTVAASPWNVAPWTFATVHVLDGGEPWEFVGDVYGPALYENDRLRRTERHRPTGRLPRVGDRIAVSSFGSYTMVHGRTFGQIPLPPQYIFDANGWQGAP